MSRRRLLTVLGAVAVVVVVIVGLTQSRSDNPAPAKPDSFDLAAAQRALAGAPAPLAALHSESNRLIAGTQSGYDAQIAKLKGHPIVVNKWASWCPPCRGEFPVLQQASTSFGKRVAFIGLDSSDNDGDATRFLSHFPVPYPSLVDRNSRIAQKLEIGRTYPTTLYYDAQGKVSYIHQGPYTTDAAFARDIQRYALGQKAS
jgi:cytochrome c biogenesis protein CcmG, thiol:disulfide interchange protein DsbE